VSDLREQLLDTFRTGPDADVTVCAACELACCWYGKFMCQSAQGADVKVVKRSELAGRPNPGEHPENWTDDAIANGGVARRPAAGGAS
jgi:hypothetical protein